MACLAVLSVMWVLPAQVYGQASDLLVSEIRVRGNELTEESLIRWSCGLNEGQPLVLPDDPARAIRNLHRMGMFADIQILVDQEAEEGVAVEIVVREHPKLGEVTFEGNKKISKKKLSKTLGFIKGQWISPEEQQRAQVKLAELYVEEGYLLATASVKEGDRDEEGRVPLTFTVNEGQKVRLKRIQFFGNASLSEKKLRKEMKETKQIGGLFGNSSYSEAKYEEDKQNVIAYYQKNGFRNAEIARDSLYYDESMKHLFIDITVEEGARYTFGKITWDGNEKVVDPQIKGLIVASEGQIYSAERVSKSREDIYVLYNNLGFIAAAVEPRETPADSNRVDVHFHLTENKPWKIREVSIAGNTKTKDRVIRRELWIRPGQTFRRSLIERSIRNLQQLNFFSNVEPDLKPSEESSELDLTFKVEEKPTGTASVGAGYSEQDGLVGTIALQIPNFLGNGQQLDFQWEFGTHRETFRIGFTEPWFKNTPTSLSGSLYRNTQTVTSDFDQRQQGGVVRVGRRLKRPDFSRASVGYKLEQVKFFNFTDAVDEETRQSASLQSSVISSVNLNFTRDSRDLPLFATSGSVFSYTPTFAGGPVLGNTNFHKHDFLTSFYFPLFWKFAISSKSQLGVVTGYNGGTPPFNELYTPGGVDIFDGTMVRGYPEQSLGPRINGVPAGGRSQLLLNIELSVPVVKQQFYALAFADAGNAWSTGSEISLYDLRRSLGFGFRIVAPVVGIMGFDFAWGIDRERVDNGKIQMVTHFQFGPQFY
jgi:outer membrane protein insertion porin family